MLRRAELLCLVGELLAETLVGVGELLALCGRRAVLLPELLHDEFAAPLLALDVGPHVGLQVGGVLLPAACFFGEECVVDGGRVHA